MATDADHALDHPEAAAWVLGALDSDDKAAFEEHLSSCEHCQAQVSEYAVVARSLPLAAPAAEPPGDLELKVLAAVQQAARAESAPVAAVAQPARAKVARRPWRRRWPEFRWASPLYAAVAAAAVTAAVFVSAALIHTSPAVAATISLRAQPGYTGSGMAVARATQGGFEISLTVKDLPVPPNGQFYECWYAGPGNRPGHPELITAGTFTVGKTGGQTYTMWSAADPARFEIMQITLEQPGDAGQHGKVILSGISQT
jgi:anti-sigma-K factor RskA